METKKNAHYQYWKAIWRQFRQSRTGLPALICVLVFALVGVYAPFLASSKPFITVYDGSLYFPLFRYLFYTGFYTKPLDIFYNLLMFAFPGLLAAVYVVPRHWRYSTAAACLITAALFIILMVKSPSDPASDPELNRQRQEAVQEIIKKSVWSDSQLTEAIPDLPDWNFELQFMTPYAKLNEVLRYKQRLEQHQHLKKYEDRFLQRELNEWLEGAVAREKENLRAQGVKEQLWPPLLNMKLKIIEETPDNELRERVGMPTLWQVNEWNEEREMRTLATKLETMKSAYQTAAASFSKLAADFQSAASDSKLKSRDALNQARRSIWAYKEIEAKLLTKQQKRQWLQKESERLSFTVNPPVRSFHWEDDAGGEQDLNRYLDWWDLTRINRKDLLAGLIFGIRVSLFVGIMSVALALAIGLPVGAAAGYYAGTTDIVVCRILEIWESMPVFFMLLMVVAITQSKSIFLVIAVIGTFGWTGFSRFLRGEFFKQRNLPYVDACRAMGFKDKRIIFSHILPNALPPILTLLPFAIMGAITSEAGLSFLGLGEEGSCSWGVLMDEGRNAFPGESYLLWPPAILLTILLVAIALVGDAMRDAIDPKLRR